MADEARTDATLPDAVSSGAGLFGDEEPASPVDGDGDEQPTNERGQDEREAQERAAAEDSPSGAREQAATAEALKVVVSVRGERSVVGVQRTGADPHIEAFVGGDLPTLAQEVPAVVERARARWEETPKHPAHKRPAPAKAAAPAKRRQRSGPGQAEAAAPQGRRSNSSPRRCGSSRGQDSPVRASWEMREGGRWLRCRPPSRKTGSR